MSCWHRPDCVMLVGIGFFCNVATDIIAIKVEETSPISTPADLADKKVATVLGSSSVSLLQAYGAKVDAVDRLETAYMLLHLREVDAVVYDSPALLFHASHSGAGKVSVVGAMFDHQDYGIALTAGSALREDINRTLLHLRENGVYDWIYDKWFGE